MNINERFDQVLNAIKGINPDEALSKQVTDQAATIADLQSQVKNLTDSEATNKARITELETENTNLKESVKTAEANATKFENELKQAKATIENPEGEIQKRVNAGVAKGLAEAGQPPVGDTSDNETPKGDLKGRDRVAAAFNAKLNSK